jgi:hypothetical protein
MTHKLFDLEQTTDLPEEIKSKIPSMTVAQKILNLFQIESNLSLWKIKIGLLRKYRTDMAIGCISVHLSSMKKRGLTTNPQRGIWGKAI